jgi:uroporphyrin-3 C-methyltransferase
VSTEPEKPKNNATGADKKVSTEPGSSMGKKGLEDKPAIGSQAQAEPSKAADYRSPSSGAGAGAAVKSASAPGAAGKSTPSGSAEASGAAPARPTRVEQKAGSSGGSWLSGLAFLLALLALAGTAYQWWMQQRVVDEVQEEPWRDQVAQLGQQSGALKTKLESELGAIEDEIKALESEIDASRSQLQLLKQETNSDIEQLSVSNEDLLQQVANLGRTDRDDWKLAEVEYLLRLAHQRVAMGGELNSAASLLTNADNILLELNMAGLHQVRKQVALDLAAVRAAQQLDNEGTYLRLEALQQQSSDLPFFSMPTISESDEQSAEPAGDLFDLAAEDWQAALDKGWDQAVEKFKTLVVVQKREGAVEPLLSEAWQRLVRERLALDLEQAKNALVLQQQTIYREALGNAGELVEGNYSTDDPATRSVLKELKELQQETIVAELPDVSGSQEAIRAYIDRKFQARESKATAAEEPSIDSTSPASTEGGYDWQKMGTD